MDIRIPSWKGLSTNATHRPWTSCAVVNCANEPLYGGHVFLELYEFAWFIVPVCGVHNTKQFDGDNTLQARRGVLAVQVNPIDLQAAGLIASDLILHPAFKQRVEPLSEAEKTAKHAILARFHDSKSATVGQAAQRITKRSPPVVQHLGHYLQEQKYHNEESRGRREEKEGRGVRGEVRGA